jgi:uncharacterized membrane protein YdcZ (DUF606 family)
MSALAVILNAAFAAAVVLVIVGLLGHSILLDHASWSGQGRAAPQGREPPTANTVFDSGILPSEYVFEHSCGRVRAGS